MAGDGLQFDHNDNLFHVTACLKDFISLDSTSSWKHFSTRNILQHGEQI